MPRIPYPFGPSKGDDATAARTALMLTVMVCTPEQILAAENSLVWLITNRPGEHDFRRALDELRMFAQVSEEDDE